MLAQELLIVRTRSSSLDRELGTAKAIIAHAHAMEKDLRQALLAAEAMGSSTAQARLLAKIRTWLDNLRRATLKSFDIPHRSPLKKYNSYVSVSKGYYLGVNHCRSLERYRCDGNTFPEYQVNSQSWEYDEANDGLYQFMCSTVVLHVPSPCAHDMMICSHGNSRQSSTVLQLKGSTVEYK